MRKGTTTERWRGTAAACCGAAGLALLGGCGRVDSFPPAASAGAPSAKPGLAGLSEDAGSSLRAGSALPSEVFAPAAPRTAAPSEAAPDRASAGIAAGSSDLPAASSGGSNALAAMQAPTPAGAKPAAAPPKAEPPTVAGEAGAAARGQSEPPLFQGWAKPLATLVITGEMDGYVEPCGCAGKDNMKGGIARRYTFLQGLTQKGWNPLPVDVGGHVKRFGPQNEIKFTHIADALKLMKYQAVALGKRDLSLPAGDLLNVAGEKGGAFVSANAALFDADSDLIPKYRIVEIGGVKVGVTAVIGAGYQKEIQNEDVFFSPPADALQKVLPQMQSKAEFLVLLSHASPEESEALAKQFPQFQIVVTAGGADEPRLAPEIVPQTKTGLVECGHKGMYLVAIGIYGKGIPWRYQRVPLDSRWADAPSMVEVMRTYQQRLEREGLKGLGLNPVAHPSGREFVGSAACADCHTNAHSRYLETTHAKAWKTLAELPVPRHHDPECLSCHVVGWEPQKFYPYKTGYLDATLTPLLKDNGCENCHGPGGLHVAAEENRDKFAEADLKARRKQMHSDLSTAEQSCRTCHDIDNSPKFDFAKYWEEIKHKGVD